MFQIDLKSRKSIYGQIVDNIKELIRAGLLRGDEKLPSVRDLSGLLTVNPNTVQKAYRELERQGRVYTVSGLGTFVEKGKTDWTGLPLRPEIVDRLRRDLQPLSAAGMTREEIRALVDTLL
jgi:GntR family transcriptional regulator